MGCGTSAALVSHDRDNRNGPKLEENAVLEAKPPTFTPSYNALYEDVSDQAEAVKAAAETVSSDEQAAGFYGRGRQDQPHYGSNTNLHNVPDIATTVETEDESSAVYCKYEQNSFGINKCLLDYRVRKTKSKDERRPKVGGRNLYVDKSFTKEIALGNLSRQMYWKRPYEFTANPQLFTEGTSRFDVGQGAVGDCWFLSMLSNISDDKGLMDRIFPPDAYPAVHGNVQGQYTGLFHCKFWKFGEWCDIYTDDCLPVESDNQLWGAHSATNHDEMFVPLLEKAFAKFHGNYQNTYGGSPGDAYMTLTGGVAERIDLTHTYDGKRFHRRVTNALRSKALVSCIVPKANDGIMGLIGAHAYSLNAVDVAHLDGETILLFRVRNPWGKCEWTGPWSDRSDLWQRCQKRHVVKEDGEFWISCQDFLHCFTQATICSAVPDFDCDGKDDGLDYKTGMYGQWLGPTAAGFKDKEMCPKFMFSIPKSGEMSDGQVPVVLQLIQYRDTRFSNIISVRVDIYKVLKSGRVGKRDVVVLQELGVDNLTYHKDKQVVTRHSLPSGRYVVIPSVMNRGEEGQFLVRIFTPCPLYNVGMVPQKNMTVLSCHVTTDLDYDLKVKTTWLGEWVTNQNAGGQISYRSHSSNPQLEFWTSGGASEVITFALMQEVGRRMVPLGMKLYQLDRHRNAPLDYDYMVRHYDSSPKNTDGENGKFVNSTSIESTWVLQPNCRFILIAFSNNPSDEARFALVAMTNKNLSFRPYQFGK